MKRVLFYLLILLCCQMASFGQLYPTDTLFTINNTAYSSAKFSKLFSENKQIQQNHLSAEKALNLYILFQLKLNEAKKIKIDTLPEVQKELQISRDIAFNKFLYPTVVTKEQTHEAFERMKYFLKARHILVKINKRGNPKDTLEAYLKALKIHKNLQKGKAFEKIARKQSDDQFGKKNHGELGYFTVFDMDYQFESAAYHLNIRDFSLPIRTQFGYHIIQILEKIPNPGKIKVRHLFLECKVKNEQQTKQKIDSLYAKLVKGADFAEMAKTYSNDSKSAPLGGMLPWFGLFESYPAIEKIAFQLQIGEISTPIKTDFGYHLMQLVDKKDYSSFDECKKELEHLIALDNRSKQSPRELLLKLKKDYHFKENRELLSNYYSILDYAYADLWHPLFTLEDKVYSQEDFAHYLSQQASKDIYENFIEYINRIYDNFSNNSILAFYKKKLLENNNDLANLIENYENRILVYSITNQTVWLPAKNDKKALLKYYQKNNHYKNSDYEDIKQQVAFDYKAYLKEAWENELRKNNTITISQSTLNKIVQE